MAALFDREELNIRRHVINVFKEGELERNNNVHFLHVNSVMATNDLINGMCKICTIQFLGQEATSSILELIRKKVGATIQMSQNVRQLR